MTSAFTVSAVIPAAPDRLYNAWLDSDEHTKMTGAPARVSDRVGGAFEAWDGYIQGTNLELEPPQRIRQSWRTIEFVKDEEDSLVEISFQEHPSGTLVTIHHSHLPEHGGQYKQGWVESYFQPMIAYFGA